jgi:amidase
MARSASDAAILLQVISGLDVNDSTTLLDEVPDFMDGIADGVSGLRIGWDERYASEGIDEEVYSSVESSLRQLEGMGAEIVKVVMPVDIDEYLSSWKVICISEALDAHREFYPGRREDYGPYFQGWLDGGAGITGSDYAQANNKRQELNGLIAVALQDVDVLVCPSTSEAPYPVTPEVLYGPRDESAGSNRFQRFTQPFDFNGNPTISLPSGFTSEGLPLKSKGCVKR